MQMNILRSPLTLEEFIHALVALSQKKCELCATFIPYLRRVFCDREIPLLSVRRAIKIFLCASPCECIKGHISMIRRNRRVYASIMVDGLEKANSLPLKKRKAAYLALLDFILGR